MRVPWVFIHFEFPHFQNVFPNKSELVHQESIGDPELVDALDEVVHLEPKLFTNQIGVDYLVEAHDQEHDAVKGEA